MKKFPIQHSSKILPLILTLKTVFLAYRKTAETEKIISQLKLADEDAKFARIRCPSCRWQPNKSSRWFCSDCDYPEYFYGGCLTEWNTFETEGVCPGCAHRWIWTSCLRCAQWARHEDWYETDETAVDD